MNGHIDAIVSAIKTWAFGAAAITTVLAFMPFAATMIFLSPFYDLSPIKVNLILCSEKDGTENENDNQGEEDDEEGDEEDAEEENDDEGEEEDDEESVSIKADSEVSVEVNEYTHRPDLKERREIYLREVEEDAEEARKNGSTDKAQQLEDVARILRTLWDIPKRVEKADTTPLREAAPLPEDDRIQFVLGTGQTGRTYTAESIVDEESTEKDKSD
jgi:hypothetical protein